MTTPIDFTTSEGNKLNKASVAALPYKFDVESQSINTFNEILMDRCITSGWNNPAADILNINVDGEELNLIEDYGQLTMENIRAHCATYISNPTRQAQHQFQMYQCLMASLTDAGRLKIVTEGASYTVNGIKCGPLLFKFLMNKAAIDSRASITYIRENLAALDSYMAKVQSNIIAFNKYVKEQRTDLKARGGRTEDLLTNLWKAYLLASDKTFVRYIQNKKDAYDEGQDINEDSLMQLAENKYKTLVNEDKWNALTMEQKQIISLTAEVKGIKENRLQLGNRKKNDKKKGAEKQNDKEKDNNDPNPNIRKKNSNERFREKWAWKKVAPKSDAFQVKTFNGTKYYWCKGHKLWCKTKHDVNSCALLKNIQENSNIQSMESIQIESEDNESQQTSTAIAFMARMQEILKE